MEPLDRQLRLRGGRRGADPGYPADHLLRLLRRDLLRARRPHRRGALERARSRADLGAASLIGDTVYVADLQTTSTYGFDAANGHKVFEYPDGAYNPVISNGKEIFLTGYKTLYALRPGTGPAKTGSSRSSRKAPATAAPPKKQRQEEEVAPQVARTGIPARSIRCFASATVCGP